MDHGPDFDEGTKSTRTAIGACAFIVVRSVSKRTWQRLPDPSESANKRGQSKPQKSGRRNRWDPIHGLAQTQFSSFFTLWTPSVAELRSFRRTGPATMSVWESDDLGLVALRTTWALFGVTAVVFSLRVYCRLRYTPRLGGGLYVDDFITGGCLLMLLVFCILLSVAVQYGVGKHYVTLSDRRKVEAVMWNAILSGITPWMCTLPKFAIVTTLKRILNYGTKTTVLLWGLALTSQATVVALTAWGFAQCRPTAYQWDRSIEGGTSLDVFFALYPVPFVMRLSMPLKTRIGVAASLSLSWFPWSIFA
ncbi:hypothetical protein J7T55_002248 [Diaporthe amygdali]|uniref:uncharacterized protein n=1 Tax=Phomopsis amygdali TaxID=1214568 RepID=UPI0022FE3BE5|nr:uncharacterized protein J7T55_002248 [Diaporthe amygdali]KAJ0109056.1 hypothetical protein J7T55_002248 [Diaporthe amygdali]